MRIFYQLIIGALLISLIFSACHKENISTDPTLKLEFTADTLTFDTIFTTLGSVTQRFTVRNPHNSTIELSSVFLAGSDSPFRLNINGKPGNRANNIQIESNDSLFIFVEATIDPTGQNNPLLIHDSIVFERSGVTQDVDLLAYGQDVHLLDGKTLQTQNWTNDKPYLIYNSAIVDENQTLTIDKGCRIHFHEGASLFVKGSLKINGTEEERVIFQGDRLEEYYHDKPGQWGARRQVSNGIQRFGGLHFLRGSSDNVINYAVVKNAEKGIQADSLIGNATPGLILKNTIIENMSVNCLVAQTSEVVAENCIFANGGSHTVRLQFGGKYNFNHCTMASYYQHSTRNYPVLFLNNYYEHKEMNYVFDFSGTFINCIVDGNLNSELYVSSNDAATFSYAFDHCLVKTGKQQNFDPNNFPGSILNTDTKFLKEEKRTWHIAEDSPARNRANRTFSELLPMDLNQQSRLADDAPDIGALEYFEEVSEE